MVSTFPFLFDKMIGDMVVSIFGSPLVAGLFILMFFYIVGLAMRLTFEVQMVMMVFASIIVVSLFIPGIVWVIAMLAAILFAVFVVYPLMKG